MDTDDYASLVLKQIEAGEFYIVTHPYNLVHIRERYEEVERAFATYAPRFDGDEGLDARYIAAHAND
jgi:hypothetical protein